MLCSVVDLRVLADYIEHISKEARLELFGALLHFIKCITEAFFIKTKITNDPTHTHNITRVESTYSKVQT